jgi:hypothetical protein
MIVNLKIYIMSKNQIGLNAGIIWKIIEKNSTDTEIRTVMKKSKLKKEDFHQALGWLAREGKIVFTTGKNMTYIFLLE